MVPITGTTVPTANGEMRLRYMSSVSGALRQELGQSARAAKTIMGWTGASERAAKYWLAGVRAPSGWELVMLAKNSDAVLQEFLKMCDRNLFPISVELEAAEAALGRAAAIVHALRLDSNHA